MVVWHHVVGVLVIGYLCMTRSFAYIGLAPLSLFIGEIALAAFIALKPRVLLGTWMTALLRPSPLNALALALLFFMVYGVWQVIRGVNDGSSLLYTFKFFIFNYYSLYLFLGLWVGLKAPDQLPRLVRMLAWVNGVYGFLWVVALRYLSDYHLPGSEVKIFGQPGGGAYAILGLLCFERNLRAVWPILALNIIVVLAMQVRAEWLALSVGIFIWGMMTGRIGKVVSIGVAALALVSVIELADIEIPGRNRDSTLSISETLGRALSPISKELASEISPKADQHASTYEWRITWWDHIWDSIHADPRLEAFGHGYGFDLIGLAPESVKGGQEENDVRTPHSVFYFALGYSGWVGVIAFAVLQLTIFRLIWKGYRVTGIPVGVLWWAAGMSAAFFEQSFDTPYKSIPFYLLMGLAMAPALLAEETSHARSARAQFLPAARR